MLLAVTTISFDIAALELYLPLTCSAQVILATADQAADPRQLAMLIDDASVTVMQATPATWRMLLESGWQPPARLRMLCGGEALAPDLARRLRATSATLWNMYGPTETTIWSSVDEVDDGPITIGRPIANTQFYVLDPLQQVVPVGVTGELYIGGTGLARGYHARPALTAERFPTDPFHPDARLYRTGDLARYRPDRRVGVSGTNRPSGQGSGVPGRARRDRDGADDTPRHPRGDRTPPRANSGRHSADSLHSGRPAERTDGERPAALCTPDVA